MQPRDLQPAQFAGYPPQARTLLLAHLQALRQLPLSFLPGLLREIVDYDFKFPAERTAVEKELAHLSSLPPSELRDCFRAFAQIFVSTKLEQSDWVNQPAQFVEQLSAHLWTTQQLDAYRNAATAYGDRLRPVVAPPPPATPRLGIAIIGQDVASFDALLFRNLRKHGAYFNQVNPDNGLQQLLTAAAARAQTHADPFAHWYVDGGEPADHSPLLTCVSYHVLEPMRSALLNNIQREIRKPGMGPEELRTHLAKLTPSDLGVSKAIDPVLDRFQLKLLTEGSGTQIFSTTFVQWTTREALRRAQPLTLVVRFAPRQRQRPMNELLSNSEASPELDPLGSLIDADMAAYYHWINQQRLSGAEQSSFLVWFEGHSDALAISPSLPRGTESHSPVTLAKLLSLVTA